MKLAKQCELGWLESKMAVLEFYFELNLLYTFQIGKFSARTRRFYQIITAIKLATLAL